MKKLLVLLMLATGVVSQAQFSSTQDGWDESYLATTSSGGFNFVTTADTALTLSKVSSTNAYSSFGYFTFDSSGAILKESTLTFDSSGKAALGDFASGTNIGLWMQTSVGKVYSIQSMNTNNFYAVNWWGETTSAGDPVYRMGGLGNYSIDDLKFTLSSGSSTPSGQPLPGVLAGVLIGLACAGFHRLRRTK